MEENERKEEKRKEKRREKRRKEKEEEEKRRKKRGKMNLYSCIILIILGDSKLNFTIQCFFAQTHFVFQDVLVRMNSPNFILRGSVRIWV